MTTFDDTDLEHELRQAFAARARSTRIATPPTILSIPEPVDLHPGDDQATPPRRRWLVPATAAAATCLVIGGLVALVGSRDSAQPADQPPTSQRATPTPTVVGLDLVIDDALAIDLDSWRLDDGGPLTASFPVLDTSALPDDVTVDNEEGSVLLDFDAGLASDDSATYRYHATLQSDRYGTVHLAITDSAHDICPANETSSLMVRGTAGAHTANGLCWFLPTGPSVELSTDNFATDPVDLVGFAESLGFTTVAELPIPTPLGPVVASGIEMQFAGTIDGATWSAHVDPGPLRSMMVYVDGRSNSGFESDRFNQPRDLPINGAGELSLSGIPGSGAIIFGYTSPDVDRVLVVRSDGQAAQLPVLRRELETFFAVPVPDGLTISALNFVNADGTVHRVADIPALPAGLGGTYGGHLQARNPEPSDAPVDTFAPVDTLAEVDAVDSQHEATKAAVRAAAQPFVGQHLDDFTTAMTPLGFEVRVTEIDGKPQPARADLRSNRINVGIDADNIVTSIISIG